MESNITKIAFITVATSGIGAAFAKKFAEQGFKLMITGRRKEKIEQLGNTLQTAIWNGSENAAKFLYEKFGY
ncbi:MAG: SDR family NAD(P)-dependent oxidoreductase [Ignavibacteriaceae bacterium]|jgi:NADP-dependent 3-hydroxy acid dehydrogenase YdfG